MSNSPKDLVVATTKNNVTTLRLNNPKRLNGWTAEMMKALHVAMGNAAKDPETKAVILTGTDPYYCAGVNLGGVVQLGHPKELHAMIVGQNQGLFDLFIDFPKPILIAVNGPAIGACVTSATLCDGIIASEKATFSTPFAKLGVPPEGCSSVHFERLLGADVAERMLGKEAYRPDGKEAKEIGLVQWVAAHEELLTKAQEIAEGWVAEGRERGYRAGATKAELNQINARESIEVANAFLGEKFLKHQFEFLWSKGKQGPALMFLMLWLTRPLWSQLF